MKLTSIPRQVHILQRIIQAITITVKALRKFRQLHKWVGREKPPNYKVVEPTYHIDNLKLGLVFVAGEAAAGEVMDELCENLSHCNFHQDL